MKVLFRINCFALLLLIGFFLTESLAAGLGFNVTGGKGTIEWDAVNWSHSGSDKDFHFDTDLASSGAGLLFDSAIGSYKVFNYRLNLGLEKGAYKIEDVYRYKVDPNISGKFETRGWFMSHDFGFKVFENRKMRLWLGPEFRISKSNGDLNKDKNYKIDITTLAIGPVLGLNLNMGKTVSLAFKIGALGTMSKGEIDNRFSGEDWDIESDSTYSFASAGIIFKLGEY